jgi:hypothetical protein
MEKTDISLLKESFPKWKNICRLITCLTSKQRPPLPTMLNHLKEAIEEANQMFNDHSEDKTVLDGPMSWFIEVLAVAGGTKQLALTHFDTPEGLNDWLPFLETYMPLVGVASSITFSSEISQETLERYKMIDVELKKKRCKLLKSYSIRAIADQWNTTTAIAWVRVENFHILQLYVALIVHGAYKSLLVDAFHHYPPNIKKMLLFDAVQGILYCYPNQKIKSYLRSRVMEYDDSVSDVVEVEYGDLETFVASVKEAVFSYRVDE